MTALSLAACAAPTDTTRARVDAGSVLACQAFDRLAADLRAGIVTDAELRTRMRAVYDQAAPWPDSQVSRASAAIVAELNTGTLPTTANTERLVAACATTK